MEFKVGDTVIVGEGHHSIEEGYTAEITELCHPRADSAVAILGSPSRRVYVFRLTLAASKITSPWDEELNYAS